MQRLRKKVTFCRNSFSIHDQQSDSTLKEIQQQRERACRTVSIIHAVHFLRSFIPQTSQHQIADFHHPYWCCVNLPLDKDTSSAKSLTVSLPLQGSVCLLAFISNLVVGPWAYTSVGMPNTPLQTFVLSVTNHTNHACRMGMELASVIFVGEATFLSSCCPWFRVPLFIPR